MSLAIILISGKRLHHAITGQIDQRRSEVIVIKIRAVYKMPARDINIVYWRNSLQSLNVNNIRQPDLVPSGPDKEPHPMRAPGQIWH